MSKVIGGVDLVGEQRSDCEYCLNAIQLNGKLDISHSSVMNTILHTLNVIGLGRRSLQARSFYARVPCRYTTVDLREHSSDCDLLCEVKNYLMHISLAFITSINTCTLFRICESDSHKILISLYVMETMLKI